MSKLYVAFLKKLVDLDIDLNEASDQFNSFGFDQDLDLVVLTKINLVRALELYIDDKLSSEEVERWANMIESNESISVSDNIVEQIVYELSNPYLTEPLSIERAKTLLSLAKS